MLRHLPIIALACVALADAGELPSSIRVGINDFCPYTCVDDPNRPGFTAEILYWALARRGIAVEFVVLGAWEQGVADTREGKLDGLLAPAHAEAQGLRFPPSAIAKQGECFYVAADDGWQLEGAASFAGRHTLVYQGWSYQARYEKHFGDQYGQWFTAVPYDKAYLAHALVKLDDGSIDGFWEDPNVYRYRAQTLPGATPATRLAGCLGWESLFFGISPALGLSADSLIDAFEQGLVQLRGRGGVDAVLGRYHLRSPADTAREQ